MKKIVSLFILALIIISVLNVSIYAYIGKKADYSSPLIYISNSDCLRCDIEVYVNDNNHGYISSHIWSSFNTSLRVDAQITIEYTDGTYDYVSGQGQWFYDTTYGECYKPFNYNSSKTIDTVYADIHMYYDGFYYDTEQHDFQLSDFYPY